MKVMVQKEYEDMFSTVRYNFGLRKQPFSSNTKTLTIVHQLQAGYGSGSDNDETGFPRPPPNPPPPFEMGK